MEPFLSQCQPNLSNFWQARYKYQLDPTVEDVRKLCTTCRKYAKSERVLFHYNGHGVPKPTSNGEIWLFNKVSFHIAMPFSVNRMLQIPLCDMSCWCRVIHSISRCQSVT